MYREYTPVQEKHTAKWKGSEYDRSVVHTNAHKSYSVNRSTEIGNRSPYKSMAVSRLEDARKTIDQVIVDLSQKKDMNNEALREIRSVNSEIVEDFRRQPYEPKVSVFNVSSAQTQDYKSAYASTNDLRASPPPQDESLALRSRLNEELRRNNELLLRLSQVEDENKHMKKEYHMSFGPNAENEHLRAENQLLRMKLSQMSRIPQQIFSEIQELKRENQALRGDTVRLLRKIERF